MSIRQRLDAVTQLTPYFMTEKPPVPRSVKIELVPRCYYKCTYCSLVARKDQPTEDMEWSLFTRIAYEMKKLGVQEVGPFLIGESFCNFPLLHRAVSYLKKDLKFPYVFLTTNASLASPKRVEELMKAGLDSLKWSCNAADKEQFSFMMNVDTDYFERAKNNIKSAWEVKHKHGYKTKLYASSIKFDEEQLSRAEPFLEKYVLPYVDEHYWLPLYTMGGVTKAKTQEIGYVPTQGNPGRVDSPVDPIPCWTLFTAAHILHDGRMTACCADGTGYWEVGDLRKMSFMKAWHSKEFRALRRAHLRKNINKTKCLKCVLAG